MGQAMAIMLGQQVKRQLRRCAGAFAACALLATCGKVAQSPYVESVEELPSGFFRVFADIRVKESGEIVKLDYVVACGGTVTNWTYTTPSASFGMSPHIMIVPTASGELIGARTPNVCDASLWEPWEIRSKAYPAPPDGYFDPVPDDFLPLLMWYPNADDIGFAFGYLTDKAYESPYAKMEVLSSGIAKSSLEEWLIWRESAKADYKQVGAMPGPWGHQIPGRLGSSPEGNEQLQAVNHGWLPETGQCGAALLLELPAEGKSEVLELLPDNGNPWVAMEDLSDDGRKELNAILKKLPFNGGHFFSHGQVTGDVGVRKSTGGGAFTSRSKYGKSNTYHDYYPVVPFQPVDFDPDTGSVSKWRHQILLDENWNGFGICGRTSPPASDLISYATGQSKVLRPDYSLERTNGLTRRKWMPEELMADEVLVKGPRDDAAGPWFMTGFGPVFDRNGHLIAYCCSR